MGVFGIKSKFKWFNEKFKLKSILNLFFKGLREKKLYDTLNTYQ